MMKKAEFYAPKKPKDLGKYKRVVSSMSVYDVEGDIDTIISMLTDLKKSHTNGTLRLEERIEYGYYDDQSTYLDVVHTYPETPDQRTKRLDLVAKQKKVDQEKRKVAAKKAKEIAESDFKKKLLAKGRKAILEILESAKYGTLPK